MEYLDKIGRLAKEAERELRTLSGGRKNEILERAAVELMAAEEAILAANAKDMEAARARGMSPGLLDRLALNPARIRSMADGLRQVAALEDPVGGGALDEEKTQWTADRSETGASGGSRHYL